MTQETTDIEVEVLEIDGVAPVARRVVPAENPPPTGDGPGWHGWSGQVRKLDSRWWPLWVILGIITLGLVLTVGLVLGVVALVFRGLQNLIRALLR